MTLKSVIGSLAITVVLLVVLALGLNKTLASAKYILNDMENTIYEPTVAKVIDADTVTCGSFIFKYEQRNIIYEYEIESTKYRGSHMTDVDSTIIVGDTINILYSPTDFTYSVLNDK